MKYHFYPMLFNKITELSSTSASGIECVQKGVVDLSFSFINIYHPFGNFNVNTLSLFPLLFFRDK